MLDVSTSEQLNKLVSQPTSKNSNKSWPTVYAHGAGSTARNKVNEHQLHSLKNTAEATVDELLDIMQS
ncbi:hypothetical protein [Parashewanella tropica]|uniref:hypothetical protein n=1 Tax=Parashewanella tropica TaxID=2547970 RepID=UPI001059B063|nr:hypothetical protein [Parashewanella tropica]